MSAGLFPRTWAQTASGQFDYYIGPNGLDSNNGTSTQSPWAITSLQKSSANNSKMAGKRVGLMDGTYNVSTLAPDSTAVAKLVPPSGNAGTPTVIQAVNSFKAVIVSDPGASGYVQGNVIGNGQSPPVAGNNPHDITIRGLEITANGNLPPSLGCSGIQFSNYTAFGGTGLTVDTCHIHGFQNNTAAANIGCIFIGEGCYQWLVTNCKLHDCWVSNYARNVHTNASGVHDYAGYGTVQYCTIYDCNNGTYQKNSTSIPQNSVVRYNYIYAITGMGVAFAGYNNAYGSTPPYLPAWFYNNIIENVTSVDYQGANAGPTNVQSSIYFYHNTVYSTGTVGLGNWMPTAAAAAAGCKDTFYNNILVRATLDSEYGDLTLGPAAGAWAVCDYNCWPTTPSLGIGTTQGQATLYSLAAWQALAGTPDVHSLHQSPGFVGSITAGAGAAQYKLGAGSPCIGAGRVGGASSGAAVDMGAWGGTDVNTGGPILQIGCNLGPVPASPVLSVS